MNLTWHIIKKDLRRFRLPLALWAALIVGQTVLGYMIFQRRDEEVGSLVNALHGLDTLHELVWGMQLVLGFFMVAGLIQEDALVGHQSWWVTRPITGSKLLGAKFVAFSLGFCVLPVLALLPWWLWCGYGASELAAASLQIIGGQAFISVLAFALGALTANYSRFTMAFVMTAFAWICCSGLIFAIFWRRIVDQGVARTRLALIVVVAIIALVAVIIHQFRTRRSGRSWAIFATGFALMLLTLRFAPWDWARWFEGRNQELPELAAAVAMPKPVFELGERRKAPHDDESMVTMLVGTRFDGVPRGMAINGGWVSATLHWPDGTKLERGGWAFSYIGPVASELMGASATTSARIAGENNSRSDMRTAPSVATDLGLPRSYAVKSREHAPAWDAHFKLYAYAGQLVVEVPLKPGARGGRAGHQIEVREVIRSKARDKGLTLVIAETEPVLDSDFLPGFATTAARRGTPNNFYALVSKDRAKIAWVGEERLIYTMMGTVGIMQRRIDFAPQALAYPAQPDWLDDAVLMKVTFHRVGTITRDVHAEAMTETDSSRAKPVPGEPAVVSGH